MNKASQISNLSSKGENLEPLSMPQAVKNSLGTWQQINKYFTEGNGFKIFLMLYFGIVSIYRNVTKIAQGVSIYPSPSFPYC